MGVDLKARHLAQVSINLTDFEQTPIHRVFEMVKREAERYGVAIVGSEIVGLIPKRAIELTADFYLQLENFSPAQVLENRMEAALGGAASEAPGRLAALAQPFLDAVAQPTAAPGGGSVAALAGALSASLGQMVAGLSRKKKSQAAHAEQLSEAVSEFGAASRFLAEAIDRDAASFESVMAAYKLPQGDPAEQQRREDAIQKALKGAAQVPLEVARQAAELFEKLGQLEADVEPVYAFRHSRRTSNGCGRGAGRARECRHQSGIDHRRGLPRPFEFRGSIAEGAHNGTARRRRQIVKQRFFWGIRL